MRGGSVDKVLEAREDGIRVLQRITEGTAVDIAKKREDVSQLKPPSVVSSREVCRQKLREEHLH